MLKKAIFFTLFLASTILLFTKCNNENESSGSGSLLSPTDVGDFATEPQSVNHEAQERTSNVDYRDSFATVTVKGVTYRENSRQFGKIKYYIEKGFGTYGINNENGEDAKDSFVDAANEWNKFLHSDNQLEEVQSSGSGIITVDFTLDNPVCFEPRVWPQQGGRGTTTVCLPPNPRFGGFTVYQTSLHELSHVLGLVHYLPSLKEGFAHYPSNADIRDPASVTESGPTTPSSIDKGALYNGLRYKKPVQIPPPSPPPAPSIGSSTSNCNPRVFWSSVSGVVDGYKIYRSSSYSGSYSQIATTPNSITDYTDNYETIWACGTPPHIPERLRIL